MRIRKADNLNCLLDSNIRSSMCIIITIIIMFVYFVSYDKISIQHDARYTKTIIGTYIKRSSCAKYNSKFM